MKFLTIFPTRLVRLRTVDEQPSEGLCRFRREQVQPGRGSAAGWRRMMRLERGLMLFGKDLMLSGKRLD